MQRIIASIITRVFSPEIMWLMIIVIIFSATGLLPPVQGSALLLWWYIAVVLIEVIAPFGWYFLLRLTGHISDMDISDVRERRLYFTVLAIFDVFGIAVLYWLATMLSATAQGDALMIYLVIRIAFWLIQAIGTFITYYWKISVHLTVFTTLVWILTWVYLQHPQSWSSLPVIVIAWIIIPILAWSRVVLKKHTVAQTIAGFALATAGFAWLCIF